VNSALKFRNISVVSQLVVSTRQLL